MYVCILVFVYDIGVYLCILVFVYDMSYTNTKATGGVGERGGAAPFFRVHTVDYDPFIKSQLASAQLTLMPYVVQIWSR